MFISCFILINTFGVAIAPMSEDVLKDEIPHPELTSWMFQRVPLPKKFTPSKERLKKKLETYQRSDRYISRIIKISHIFSWPWAGSRVFLKFWYLYFKIFNRVKVLNKQYIPKKGAIFYLNHPGSFDVLLINAVVGRPISCFISWDNFMLTKLGEKLFGFINKQFIHDDENVRKGLFGPEGDLMIEKSIRTILKTNSMYAIWPSGGLDDDGLVRQGFSSIVKTYTVVNSKKDIVPFIPVLLRGSDCYHIGKNPHLLPKTKKIYVKFFKPFFIPREWLDPPEKGTGGKTPREIIDYLMLKLARANGQENFAPNWSLNWKKDQFKKQESEKSTNK